MDNNLFRPFILIESGIEVNEIPKIHVDDPSIEDHEIYIQESGLRATLKIWGILSLFHKYALTNDYIYSCDKIFIHRIAQHGIRILLTLHKVNNQLFIGELICNLIIIERNIS